MAPDSDTKRHHKFCESARQYYGGTAGDRTDVRGGDRKPAAQHFLYLYFLHLDQGLQVADGCFQFLYGEDVCHLNQRRLFLLNAKQNIIGRSV